MRELDWRPPSTSLRPRCCIVTTKDVLNNSLPPYLSGQNLVSKPAEQMEETAGGGHGGCQPGWRGRPSSAAPSSPPPALGTSSPSLHATPGYQDCPPDTGGLSQSLLPQSLGLNIGVLPQLPDVPRPSSPPLLGGLKPTQHSNIQSALLINQSWQIILLIEILIRNQQQK